MLIHMHHFMPTLTVMASHHCQSAHTSPVNCHHCAGLRGICSFVFERNDDFEEILAFTSDMSQKYNMHVHKLQSDFKTGVEGLLETTKLQAIILGTRRYAKQEQHGTFTVQNPRHVPCSGPDCTCLSSMKAS